MGYIGSDPKTNESVSTAQLVDDSVTNAKIVDNVLFTSVTSSVVSASNTIIADTFTGTFSGALSSSAQISSDISGSFTAASSSFSSRTTTLESASGSDSTRITTLEGRVNQGVKTTDSPTFAGATVTGTLTANEIHTTFVSSSVATITGSNVFGDAVGDLHSFTGSVSISGSQTSLVTAGNVDFNGAVDMASTLDVGDVLTVDKNVSAGDLNTAPIVTFKNSQGSGHYTALKFEGADSSGANTGFFGYMSHNTPSTRRFVISHDGVNRDFAINSGSLATFIGNINQEKAGNLRHTILATGTGEAALHLHANNSTGDSFIRFQTDSTTFAMGFDNSDGDKFILSVGSDPHSDSVFNIQPDGSNITFDKATNINNSLVVSPNGAKFSVGASITGSCGTAMDVMQVGHTSQWYAETSDAADRNVYIGNNFYHDGTNHKPIYEDQVSGIQFRAGTIRFRTAGVTGLHENLDAGGGTERMRITSDGSVGIGTNNPTGHVHTYSDQRYMLYLESTYGTDRKYWFRNDGGTLQLGEGAQGDSQVAFTFDTANNEFGIGTRGPEGFIDVHSGGSSVFKVQGDGVAVGNCNPGNYGTLHVISAGDTSITGSTFYDGYGEVNISGNVLGPHTLCLSSTAEASSDVGIEDMGPSMVFRGQPGSGLDGGATFAGIAGTFDQSNSTYAAGGNLRFFTSTGYVFNPYYGTQLKEAMRIDKNQNVGIGVTSPNVRFHVRKAGNGKAGSIARFAQENDSDSVLMYGRGTGAYGASSADTCMGVATMETTGRSINAGGTINASGADYAEYETKRDDCGTIEKGDIVGFDTNGLITDKWTNAVTFGIKSTNPSYVGGDTWGVGVSSGSIETERQKVDRIAYSGKVPCNVTGSSVGDYIIPVQVGDGIGGVAKSSPTYDEYKQSVGVVRTISGSLPIVVVKTL